MLFLCTGQRHLPHGWFFLFNFNREGLVIFGNLGATIGLPGCNSSNAGDIKTIRWSAFGDFTWHSHEQLSGSAGFPELTGMDRQPYCRTRNTTSSDRISYS